MSETIKIHTPGPWEWCSFGGPLMLTSVPHGKLIVLQATRKGMQDAEFLTRDARVMRPMTPDHPDARLIAAAPELLRQTIALSHLARCMATGPGWTQDLFDEVLAKADLAIQTAGDYR